MAQEFSEDNQVIDIHPALSGYESTTTKEGL
jgi:hypothetical protein